MFLRNFLSILPWLLVIVCVEQAALFCSKEYANGRHWCFLLFCALGYAIVGFVVTMALKHQRNNIGILNNLWNICSTIAAFAIGIMIFSEPNWNVKRVLAVILGVIVLIFAA
ncbi:membrane protein [Noumeavirus]|uniref:membrane protein n=1 Tax=Noumeavirus TaxID=1955558 RepID=UPI000982F7E4|nr:membrane protein [Noumeavirus]AQM73308.1 membrane protein [Noumeavirus]